VATREKTIVALAQIDNLEHKLNSAKNQLNLGVIFLLTLLICCWLWIAYSNDFLLGMYLKIPPLESGKRENFNLAHAWTV